MLARAPEPDADSAPPEPDDPRLVERIRQGDVAAFEALYQLYWARLYAFAFRYLHSADEAADIVQDVFFRIWRRRETWRVVGRLDAYLYLAIRNGAFDRLQHAAIVQRWRQGVRDDQATAQTESTAAADAAVAAGELGAAIERALAEMPERRRAICVLRWVDGLTYAEIAARLGITEKTVETQVARGLKFLRDRIAELGG